MENTVTINGFTPNEICSLYSFLNVYEQKKIKHFKENILLSKYPSLVDVKNIIKAFTAEEKNIDELSLIDSDDLVEEFYYTKYKSKMLSVLYHLRNSIAHAKISKTNDVVSIEDFEANKTNSRHTAKGKVSYASIEKIVNIIKGL